MLFEMSVRVRATTALWKVSQEQLRTDCRVIHTHWALWSEMKQARVKNCRGKETEENEATNRGITYYILLIWYNDESNH